MGRIVVVGTGFSGAVIARKIAEELNLPVTIVEKRPHIGGNMYDEIDEHGILVQRYGPHILVTNQWKVIDYLSQYTEFFPHTVKLLSYIDGRYVRLPFNFETVQQLLGGERSQQVIERLRQLYNGRDRVPVLELVNSGDDAVAEFGNLLFEKAYRTYCAKQWDVPVDSLDKSIMDRVPMAMSYDERYMNKDFQYLPKEGFTRLIENILNHSNISLQMPIDALQHITFDERNHEVIYDGDPVDALVYTGPLDELFSLKFGELPYRSLQIKYEWQEKDRIYPEKIISFPQAKGYTRKTEYKYMMYDASSAVGSTVATEYPIAYNKENPDTTPYYPVITEETKARYVDYLNVANTYPALYLCGRLAEFRYYNMDDCILHAFDVFESVKTDLQNMSGRK